MNNMINKLFPKADEAYLVKIDQMIKKYEHRFPNLIKNIFNERGENFASFILELCLINYFDKKGIKNIQYEPYRKDNKKTPDLIIEVDGHKLNMQIKLIENIINEQDINTLKKTIEKEFENSNFSLLLDLKILSDFNKSDINKFINALKSNLENIKYDTNYSYEDKIYYKFYPHKKSEIKIGITHYGGEVNIDSIRKKLNNYLKQSKESFSETPISNNNHNILIISHNSSILIETDHIFDAIFGNYEIGVKNNQMLKYLGRKNLFSLYTAKNKSISAIVFIDSKNNSYFDKSDQIYTYLNPCKANNFCQIWNLILPNFYTLIPNKWKSYCR